jgi:hypothetical protein
LKIDIAVYDHNKIRQLFDWKPFDATACYFSEKHCMLYKWVALSNTKSNFETLKFSANIIAKGDEQVALTDEPMSKGFQIYWNRPINEPSRLKDELLSWAK